MNAIEAMDELTYRNYAANRDYGMTPEGYATLVEIDKDAFEARYQKELAAGRVKLELPTYSEPLKKETFADRFARFDDGLDARFHTPEGR